MNSLIHKIMMKLLSPRHVLAMALAAIAAPCCAQTQPQFVSMPQYSVLITSGDRPGEPPQLTLRRDAETVFTMPIIAGLGSPSSEEKLSQTTYSLHKIADGTFELNATAKSGARRRNGREQVGVIWVLLSNQLVDLKSCKVLLRSESPSGPTQVDGGQSFDNCVPSWLTYRR